MNNRTEQLPNGRRGIGEGRTIVMTETVNMVQEMCNAEALGRNIVGLELDLPNHLGYIVCERAVRALPQWPVADTQTWLARLRALDALPAPAPRRAAPTALDKLAAFFRGRRPSRTAPVQEGGAR